MGLIRDLLGSATRAECEAYAEALNRPAQATDEQDDQDDRDCAVLRAKLPETVARMVEDGRF